jgi:hypothetical protein
MRLDPDRVLRKMEDAARKSESRCGNERERAHQAATCFPLSEMP